jgi:enamine deaminase RidA (YjgF/YER057c/UK114 family)
MTGTHRLASSGSPYEPQIGFSRGVRVGQIIAISGTAPLAPDGPACTLVQVSRFIDSSWLVEVEADAVVPAMPSQ